MIGGSADLTQSNLTFIDSKMSYSNYKGRYIHYGIREHAMAAIANGLSTTNMIIPYVGTFFNFLQYCLPAVRLSALSNHKVIYIMTHDSVWLGEDGPTHQPIENLAICRAMPNLLTFRPADGNEVSGVYKYILNEVTGPSVICLSRQSIKHLPTSNCNQISMGAYIIKEYVDKLELIIIATGSEVSLCYEAINNYENIRLISMPCMELFNIQTDEYRKLLIPDNIPVLSVEAGASFGWHKYSHHQISIDTFGQSGPYKDLLKEFKFRPEDILHKVKEILA